VAFFPTNPAGARLHVPHPYDPTSNPSHIRGPCRHQACLIYINDVTDITNGCIRLFADDTVYISSSLNLTELTRAIQREINNLLSWANRWAITYNATTTFQMVISWRHQPSTIQCHMNNVPINEVRSHKHLGLTFNNKGTWDDHINTTS
jgi:hypothetical protein